MKCCCIIMGFAKMLPGDLKTETVVDLFCSQHTTQAVFNGTQMAIRPNNSAVVPAGAHRKRSGELSGQNGPGPDADGPVGRGSGREERPHVCVGECGPLLQPVARTFHVRRTNTLSCLHTRHWGNGTEGGEPVGAFKNRIGWPCTISEVATLVKKPKKMFKPQISFKNQELFSFTSAM